MSRFMLIFISLFLVCTTNSFGQEEQCPTTLVLLNEGTEWQAADVMIERLAQTGVNTVHADSAKDVTQKHVEQVQEVVTKTRSGSKTVQESSREAWAYTAEATARENYQEYSTFLQEEAVTAESAGYRTFVQNAKASLESDEYASFLEQAAASVESRQYLARLKQAAATAGFREYNAFRQEAGVEVRDVGSTVEYDDWSREVVHEALTEEFVETIEEYNAEILVLGRVESYSLGDVSGLHTASADISARAIDARRDPPQVLNALSATAEGAALSSRAASNRATREAAEAIARNLAPELPCGRAIDESEVGLDTDLSSIGIGVSEFSYPDRTFFRSDQAVDEVASQITETELAQVPTLQVYTRTDLERVLSEQRLGLSGLVENPVEVGNIIGLPYLMLGSVTDFSVNEESHFIRVPILRSLKLAIQSTRIGLDLRVVDTQTGELIWADGTSASSWGFSILGIEYRMSSNIPIRQAVKTLIDKFQDDVEIPQ